MEEKLNIAAILQEKPSGIKLWSDTFGYVFLLDTRSDYFEIKDEINNLSWRYSSDGSLTNYKGTLSIYPSCNMRDWNKFAWKKGDVLRCGVDNLCIFESWANSNYTEFNAMYVTYSYANSTCPTKMWSKETNDDVIKQYFSNIEEIKGGKLNLSTLTIEKQPEFKNGDIVYSEGTEHNLSSIFIAQDMGNYLSAYVSLREDNQLIISKNSLGLGLLDGKMRLATDSEKQQLIDALAKENKAWDAEKKVIVDLPKKCEFKPMDWCLMRTNIDRWKLCQFGFFHKEDDFDSVPYNAVGGTWYNECIPYNDQTAHLLGTTDEWKGGNNE